MNHPKHPLIQRHSHLDLMPTMMDAAGIDIPPIMQGRSLLPDVHGEAGDTNRPVPIEFMRFSINHDSWGGFQPIRAVIKGDWKLVINLLHSDELYNLKEDPAELDNRIDDDSAAGVRTELHRDLLNELDRVRDPFRGPTWERRPWGTERTLEWNGPYRHRPEDGFLPITLAYKTGQPPERWVED